MPNEQKPFVDQPDEDNSPQKKSTQPRSWFDTLGWGRMMDKLPLHKLTARMAYCMYFDLVLLFFVLVLDISETHLNDFPNAWDIRFIVITSVVVFFVGLFDIWKGHR